MQQNRTLPNWRLLLKLKWRLQSPRPLQGGYVYTLVMTFVCKLFIYYLSQKILFRFQAVKTVADKPRTWIRDSTGKLVFSKEGQSPYQDR